MSHAVYFVSISEYSTAEDSGFVVRKAGSTGSNTQLTITTSANTNYLRFWTNIDRTSVTLEEVLAINRQLERWDTPTTYHEYVEWWIYTDWTTETIWSHGKNLFDKSTALLGDITTNGGYTSRTYRVVSDYIPVRYGQTFVGSGTLLDTDGVEYSANVIKAFYKADKSYITGSRGSVAGNKFTIDDNECAYIRIVFFNTSLVAGKTASIENSNLQLEEGSIATTYEPYYNGGTATAETLLKIWNYADEQEILSGSITRNVGIKVFDGTENWITGNGGVWYNFQSDVGSFDTTAMICSHYSYAWAWVLIVDISQNQFSSYSNGNIAFKSAETISATDFKTFLSDQYNAWTPVIVFFALATPTTERVAGHAIHIPSWNSTIEITQASINNLWLYAKYKATA